MNSHQRLRVLRAFFVVAFAVILAFTVVSFTTASTADAHPKFTCAHGDRGHWTWNLKYHEVRLIRQWWSGGRHYHRYAYYTWSRSTSWVFRYRVTYDCTGAHSN